MAKISVRYFVSRKRDDGKTRYYWQPNDALRKAGWKQERLEDDYGRALKQAEDINAAVDEWRLAGAGGKPSIARPGTVDAMIASYKKSRRYNRLAEKTSADYDHYLELISQWAGDEAAAAITAKMVQDLYATIRDKKPRKAMYLIQVLRLLFKHGENESLIPKNSNPASKPEIEYKAAKGVIWSPAAVAHFVATADRMKHYAMGTAVMLDEWWGQRLGDVVTMQESAIRDGFVTIVQSKTGAGAILDLKELPAAHRARVDRQLQRNHARKIVGLNFLQQRNGLAYTVEGFQTQFYRIRDEAAKTMPEIKKLVFKDLRHTAVTRLAEAGVDVPGIASITGHSIDYCQKIIDTYLVRTRKMASAAMRQRREAEQG